MKTFFRRLLCMHYWINDYYYMPDIFFIRGVGLKNWQLNTSTWGCKKCGKVKKFKYDFIPLNFEETK